MHPQYVWYRFPVTGLERLDNKGPGAYPYPCIHADKYPNDPVYIGPNTWTTPRGSGWADRIKEWDGLESAPVCG